MWNKIKSWLGFGAAQGRTLRDDLPAPEVPVAELLARHRPSGHFHTLLHQPPASHRAGWGTPPGHRAATLNERATWPESVRATIERLELEGHDMTGIRFVRGDYRTLVDA